MMATVRGILVKRFGGPEVLEHVTNIVQSSNLAARQVFRICLVISCFEDFCVHLFACLLTYFIN